MRLAPKKFGHTGPQRTEIFLALISFLPNPVTSATMTSNGEQGDGDSRTYGGDGGDGDLVLLDVGGWVFKTTRSTLAASAATDPDSVLAVMFGPPGSTGAALGPARRDPSTGAYFLDRDPDVFRVVLRYLRTGALHLPTEASSSWVDLDCVVREAEFFGLGSLARMAREQRDKKKRETEEPKRVIIFTSYSSCNSHYVTPGFPLEIIYNRLYTGIGISITLKSSGWQDRYTIVYDELQSKNVFFAEHFWSDRERKYDAWCKEERAKNRNPPFDGFLQQMKKLHKDIMDNFDQYFGY